MAQEIVRAESFFDRRFGISSRDLDRVLDRALEKKADYADLYFEYRVNEAVSLEEGIVKNASQSTANGVGVRVLAQSKTGYRSEEHTSELQSPLPLLFPPLL